MIGYHGVMAIVLNETPPASSNPAPTAPAAPGLRVQQASAYALQFGQVYLNASPAKAITPPSPPPVNSDDGAQSALMRQLPAFFAAYGSGDQSTLGRLLAPGTTVTGLGGSVVFGSVTGVTASAGGDVRHIVATVVWDIPGQPGKATRTGNTAANLEMTYALSIVKQHGTWYVQSIAPSTQAGGQPWPRAPVVALVRCSTTIPLPPE
jgi:hypothetical protein